MLPKPMPRRALLIFADDAKLDLARRGLPGAALPLLQFPSFRHESPVTADIHVFSSAARPSRDAGRSHRQCGAGFAERLENAIETLSALGYDEIVAIGRDCPSLGTADIAEHSRELVLPGRRCRDRRYPGQRARQRRRCGKPRWTEHGILTMGARRFRWHNQELKNTMLLP